MFKKTIPFTNKLLRRGLALLCALAGTEGRVLAFDIQQCALDQTEALLAAEGLRAELHLDSHAFMANYAAADILLGSKEEARNAPTPVTTYALFHDGEYITNEQMNDRKFLKLAGR